MHVSRKSKDDSSSESETEPDTDSSYSTSSSDDIRETRRKYKRHSRKYDKSQRRRSPPTPKLPTFNGDGNWDSFIFQFERLADRYKWNERKSRERLLDCLKDKALEFAKEIRSRDYNKVKKNLSRRFSRKEAPIAARRQLMSIRQKEGESLEEYSQRVQFLCMDGHPEAREETIDQISVEAFLRGCRDKEAAKSAMEKNPHSVYKALKYVKASINNQQALFGHRPSYSTRQVTFEDEVCSLPQSVPRVRNISPYRTSTPTTENQSDVKQLVSAVSELVKKLNTSDPLILASGDLNRRSEVYDSRPLVNENQNRRHESRRMSGEISSNRSRSASPASSPNQTKRLCYGCRKPGHFQADCPERVKQRGTETESLNKKGLSLPAKPQSPARTRADSH